MICYIYRSLKKDGYYLYLAKKDDFSPLNEELVKSFGKTHFAMMLDLTKKTLANADNEKVIEALKNQGFYLQVPPPIEKQVLDYKISG